MISIIQTITELIEPAIQKVCRLYGIHDANDLHTTIKQVQPLIVRAARPEFGDYQCNVSMKLGKQFGVQPRTIAQQIVNELTNDQDVHTIITQLTVAGAGFINLTLSTEWIGTATYQDCIKAPTLAPINHTKQRIVVDFSSPNIAKHMHVGHLRSTIIGDSIARICEFLGHEVIRLNHLGDWGTQFGMLITYIQWYTSEAFSSPDVSIDTIAQWYRLAKEQFDTDSSFKKASQEAVVALQAGNREYVKTWQKLCDLSYAEYQTIYDTLDIRLTARGESFYNEQLPGVVADVEQTGIATISDGATCVFMPGFTGKDDQPLPLIVRKADGGYNYATTDLAALKHRVDIEKADRIIYVVDAGQGLHFDMMFEVARRIGYLNEHKVRVEHVGFGLVLGPDGKRYRSRSGDTEKLDDLIGAAITHATAVVIEKRPDLPVDTAQQIGKTLGIGALKYADLSGNRLHDYQFSYEKMLQLEGNTCAFLLYSYVRSQSIERKLEQAVQPTLNAQITQLTLEHPTERALALNLLSFADIIIEVTDTLMPNRLADYLYHLAQLFNQFFRDCRVIDDPREQERRALIQGFARTMKTGLNLLGIQTVEQL